MFLNVAYAKCQFWHLWSYDLELSIVIITYLISKLPSIYRWWVAAVLTPLVVGLVCIDGLFLTVPQNSLYITVCFKKRHPPKPLGKSSFSMWQICPRCCDKLSQCTPLGAGQPPDPDYSFSCATAAFESSWPMTPDKVPIPPFQVIERSPALKLGQ